MLYIIYIIYIQNMSIISWMITYAIGRRIDGTQKWSLGLFAEATWSSFPLPEPWCAYRGDLAIKTWGVHIIRDAIINYSGKSMIIGRITNIIWIIIIHILHRDHLSAIGRIWVEYHSLTTTAQKLMLSKRLSAGHFMISYYELVCKEKLQLP